jgi:hypothetical protein
MKKILLKIVKKRLTIKGHHYNLEVATFCERCITACNVMNNNDLKSFIKSNIDHIKIIALPSHKGLTDNLEELCI